jgi:lysophospholipase L1-like esterase
MAAHRQRAVGLLVLVALAGLVGSALAEAVVRLYASFNESFGTEVRSYDILAARVEPLGSFGFRQKPNSTFRYSNGTVATSNGMGFRGPAVARPKPAHTFRIILLGGSTTHGWEVNDDQTIDAYLREILPRIYPGREYEAVNLAFDGYDTNALVERLRYDGMALDPDLVIVNEGINDVRNAKLPDLRERDPRIELYHETLTRLREIQRRGHATLWTLLKHWSYTLRLPGMIRSNLAARGSAARAAAQPPNPRAGEFFERNLRSIADLAETRHVPILFSTPPSALTSKYKPHDTSTVSYWIVDAATTQHVRDSLAKRMERVAEELAKDGRHVRYVHPDLPSDFFLDDCHLTPIGNRRMAETFAAAIEPLIQARELGRKPRAAMVTRVTPAARR